MTNDEALAEAVVAWARDEFPDHPVGARRAAEMARVSLANGAPVTEACGRVRAFMGSWFRHPAHARGDVYCPLQEAS